jgi:hypothetical protein
MAFYVLSDNRSGLQSGRTVSVVGETALGCENLCLNMAALPEELVA